MATAHKDRGKSAEAKVAAYLGRVNEQLLHFDWLRLPDARTAMGRMPAMPGDFEFFAPKVHGILEVKEVDHEFRVPAKNITQLPKLRKRILAGGWCYVLVHFTKTGMWRLVPADELELKETGSWDLSGYPAHPTLAQALPTPLLGGA